MARSSFTSKPVPYTFLKFFAVACLVLGLTFTSCQSNPEAHVKDAVKEYLIKHVLADPTSYIEGIWGDFTEYDDGYSIVHGYTARDPWGRQGRTLRIFYLDKKYQVVDYNNYSPRRKK